MGEYLKYIIPTFIIEISMIYVWYRLLNKKINFKDYRLYVTIIGLMIITVFNFISINKFIRVVILTIIFMFFFRYLFKESLNKCIVIPIFYQLIIFISEFLSFIIINLFLEPSKTVEFFGSTIGIYVINIMVFIITIVIINIKFVRNIYNKIISLTAKINTNQLIIICIITILFFNIFVVNTYYKLTFYLWMFANIFFILVLFIAMIYSLKTQNNLKKVEDKYNISIKSLNDFEEMMSKYRVANHENKNLLLTIRAMIINKEKDIPKYIDSMIEEKYIDDEKLMFDMAVIPTGGLRATIYSSILKIKNNNINCDFNVDSKIRTVDLIELDTNTIMDVCKIIGVFIDNAIDETKKLKFKNIKIDLYVNHKNINIKISNMFKDMIDVNKIYVQGYTTKTKGHGYGLALVKEIIKNNNLLKNYTEINKNIFSQILEIETKKNTKKLKNRVNGSISENAR